MPNDGLETVLPGGGGGVPGANIPVVTSHPKRLLRHSISDEELEMLGESKRNGLSEFMWAMFAMATGVLPSAMAALWGSYIVDEKDPLNLLELLNVVTLGVGLSLAILSAFIVRSKERSAQSLIKSIRDREFV